MRREEEEADTFPHLVEATLRVEATAESLTLRRWRSGGVERGEVVGVSTLPTLRRGARGGVVVGEEEVGEEMEEERGGGVTGSWLSSSSWRVSRAESLARSRRLEAAALPSLELEVLVVEQASPSLPSSPEQGGVGGRSRERLPGRDIG